MEFVSAAEPTHDLDNLKSLIHKKKFISKALLINVSICSFAFEV